MTAFIEHKTDEFTQLFIDPEKVSSIVTQEHSLTIYLQTMTFSFGVGSIYGDKATGIEVAAKILDWREMQFDRAEKLRNMLAEDPLERESDPA